MDYIEYFSKLFSAKKYEEAAFQAIYSPKGVLRTRQTLKYFKNIDEAGEKEQIRNGGGVFEKSYLLHYCTMLVSTVSIVGRKMTPWETIESFRCAIHHQRLDLVEFWLATSGVEVTKPLGNILLNSCVCTQRKCCCKNVALAEVVYRKLHAHLSVLHVMLHQGRYATALSYAVNETPERFKSIDFARMLEDEEEGCQELAFLMVNLHPSLQVEEIVVSLVTTHSEHIAIILVKECCDANRPLAFSSNHFAEWDGNPTDAQRFGAECWENGYEDIACRFMAACVTSHAMHYGKVNLM